MYFRDRYDAGRKLAAALAAFKGQDCVVLALPRGGVPIGAEIAESLGAPLDVLLVRKIGAPYQPELAIGAVVDGGNPIVVRNEELLRLTGTTDQTFDHICKRELGEIERRRRAYVQGRKPLDPAGRIAIVVDDGIATGATMRAALRATRARKPSKLVLAVPVAAADTLADLGREADQTVCLATPDPFGAVGLFYSDFGQVSDDDVIALLSRALERKKAKL
jgi:predicted phosphoribosyltransferase